MTHPEHEIQKAIVSLLKIEHVFHFAVPNGEKRDVRVGARLKEEGVLPGVADLELVLPGRVIFVEIKTSTGRLSPAQKAFREAVQGLGHSYVVWRSLDDCIDFLMHVKKGGVNDRTVD